MGIQIQQKKSKNSLSAITIFKSNRVKKPSYMILPYKDILEDKPGQPILLTDDTYADMLNLPGKDLDFLNTDGDNSASEIIGAFHALLSTYTESFDIKVSQLPADTRVQQGAWGQELVRVESQLQQLPPETAPKISFRT